MTHLIQRIGSKTNDIKYFKDLLPLDVKNVVEPFGGSFAVIRDVYHDNKYNKFVNDTDLDLYYIYTHPQALINGFKFWNEINKKNILTRKKKELLMKSKLNEHVKKYIIDNSIVRGSLTKSKNITDLKDELNLIKNINFTNMDAFELIDKFKYKKDTFVFLDPPYLFSNNSGYFTQNEKSDMTEYIIYFLNLFNDRKVKAKVMLIINDLGILRHLFKDFIVGSYEKIYQISKKKMRHLIITNY